jgi:hypothetical protein
VNSKDLEGYTGSSVATTGRASLAGQAKDEEPDLKKHTDPPGWGLGLALHHL